MAMRRRLVGLLLAIGLAGCSSATPPLLPPPGQLGDGQLLSIAFNPSDPAGAMLTARLCAPTGSGRWPVAVLNHGSASSPEQRGAMRPAACDSDPVRWFTQHHFLVVSVMRRGFGTSSGPVMEDNGPCVAPDYARSGEIGADDIAATLRSVLALPQAQPGGAVLVGQSTGGWAVLAYSARTDPRVRAVLAFAPGRGAKAYSPPNPVCRADLLRAAAHEYGVQATIPVLWIAARNDTYFPPDITTMLHRAYTEAGGHAELVLVNPFFDEGHALFNAPGGSDLWGPLVQNFLSHTP